MTTATETHNQAIDSHGNPVHVGDHVSMDDGCGAFDATVLVVGEDRLCVRPWPGGLPMQTIAANEVAVVEHLPPEQPDDVTPTGFYKDGESYTTQVTTMTRTASLQEKQIIAKCASRLGMPFDDVHRVWKLFHESRKDELVGEYLANINRISQLDKRQNEILAEVEEAGISEFPF
jgi:hypothetical protein